LNKTRLEAFADGVFAIAATLLILNVDVPNPGNGHLGHELLTHWPAYVAYAVSFVTIAIMWLNHHIVFSLIGKADRTFMFLNIFLLLCIAFVPFPTRLLAASIRTPDARAAALAYGITMTTTAIFFNALWQYAISREGHLLRPDADRRLVLSITRSFRPGVPSYAAATLLAFVSPWITAVFFAAIALFYVLTGALLSRDEAVT